MESHDRRALIRSIRQRVENLSRVGLDRLALPELDLPDRHEAPREASQAIRPLEIEPSRPAATAPIPKAPPAQRLSAPIPLPVGSLFEEPAIEDPILPPGERAAALATLASEVATCTRCPQLVLARTQTVFGVGSPTARLMFIGEAPGAEEDRRGEPFVGRAGALLTDMITKGMGLARGDVYIANILKSRPPENRTPLPDEVAHCLPYLERQIAIIRPEYLCLLGKTAVSTLLETALSMGRLRGRWHRYRGIPTVVTWHPAYLLRNPAAKREAWEDLQMLMQAMGLKPSERRRET